MRNKLTIIFLVVFTISSGCKNRSESVVKKITPETIVKKTAPDTVVVQRTCDTISLKAKEFDTPLRIMPNTLGYARVRCYPHFDANDTSNMIAKIKCGTTVMVHIPRQFKDDEHPYYYHIMVKDKDGNDRVGFISHLVVKSLEEVRQDSLDNLEIHRRDSLCAVAIKKLPEEDRDGHLKQMVLNGVYTGRNLYISDPDICVYRGSIVSCTLNGSFIKNEKFYYYDISKSDSVMVIDIRGGIPIGDSIQVVLKYNSLGTPEILNPEVLRKE